MNPCKAIFFDRDGTLIVDKIYLNNPDDIIYLPHVFSALKKLQDSGYIFVVVTNQSGVPRGLVQEENIHKIHQKMTLEFQQHGILLDKFFYAPHPVDSGHPDRKPAPGMLLKAISSYNIDPTQSWMVGDRMSDVEAGHRAGAKSILLIGNDEKETTYSQPEYVAQNLMDVANWIINNK